MVGRDHNTNRVLEQLLVFGVIYRWDLHPLSPQPDSSSPSNVSGVYAELAVDDDDGISASPTESTPAPVELEMSKISQCAPRQ